MLLDNSLALATVPLVRLTSVIATIIIIARHPGQDDAA